MAVPIHFTEVDFVMGPPGGSDEAAIPMPVRRTAAGRLVSCWKLSLEEIEEIGRTGRIWLEQDVCGALQAPQTFVTALKDQVLGDAPR
jgi:hypothetical protein